MKKRCKNSEGVCQEWPKSGKLKRNMAKTLNPLGSLLKNEGGVIYAYVLTTVEKEGNCFVQTGSAPNFQGGWITLCTCKHLMRTFRTSDGWKGVWIAGFTSVKTWGDHRNYLFYLTRAKYVFRSHKELWDWLNPQARAAKNARLNSCGDIYEPKRTNKDEFRASEYYPPTENHVHAENNDWSNDIEYSNKGKRPALLVGNPDFCFLWSQPKIYFENKLPRSKKWEDIQEFIQLLVGK